MERLTFEGNFCDIAQCCNVPGGSFCEDGACSQKKVWERLKAYEDKRLETEEVLPKDKADEITLKLMRLADLESLCSYTRLRELAEADKDGRGVVLPCKVGDTVWRIVRAGEPHITRDEVRDMYFADDMTLCVELVGGRVTFTEKFGKTVFLSREEAEKALEEMEGKKDG
jgi:hypothetical protein